MISTPPSTHARSSCARTTAPMRPSCSTPPGFSTTASCCPVGSSRHTRRGTRSHSSRLGVRMYKRKTALHSITMLRWMKSLVEYSPVCFSWILNFQNLTRLVLFWHLQPRYLRSQRGLLSFRRSGPLTTGVTWTRWASAWWVTTLTRCFVSGPSYASDDCTTCLWRGWWTCRVRWTWEGGGIMWCGAGEYPECILHMGYIMRRGIHSTFCTHSYERMLMSFDCVNSKQTKWQQFIISKVLLNTLLNPVAKILYNK